MKKRRYVRSRMVASLVVSVFLAIAQSTSRAIAQGVPMAATPSAAQNTEVPLAGYLYTMGKRLGCYFTIESDGSPDTSIGDIEGIELAQNLNIATIQELQTYLIQQIQGIIVVKDQLSPNVLHIIARSIGPLTCPLGKSINIDYKGNLKMLPSALGTASGCAYQSDFQFWPAGFFLFPTDFPVEVHARSEQGRTVLTSVLPLSLYDPVIWEATEFFTPGVGHNTYIFFEPTSSSAKAQIAAMKNSGGLSPQ